MEIGIRVFILIKNRVILKIKKYTYILCDIKQVLLGYLFLPINSHADISHKPNELYVRLQLCQKHISCIK